MDPKTVLMSAAEGAPAEVVKALNMYGVRNATGHSFACFNDRAKHMMSKLARVFDV